MTTFTTIDLPASITIGNHTIDLNWMENENLDGFIAEVKSGMPIVNFQSPEDLEMAIWHEHNIASDIYLDGSAVFYKKAF